MQVAASSVGVNSSQPWASMMSSQLNRFMRNHQSMFGEVCDSMRRPIVTEVSSASKAAIAPSTQPACSIHAPPQRAAGATISMTEARAKATMMVAPKGRPDPSKCLNIAQPPQDCRRPDCGHG